MSVSLDPQDHEAVIFDLDGVRDFLASRAIDADADTVQELGERENGYFLDHLEREGVVVFESTVELVCRLQLRGVRTAVFSASRNCEPVLAAAGPDALFEARVDGVVAAELGLPGKPDPAVLQEATRRSDAHPERTVVVEDAEAGVEDLAEVHVEVDDDEELGRRLSRFLDRGGATG